MTGETATLYPDIKLTAKEYIWFKKYAEGEGMKPTECVVRMFKDWLKATMPMTEE